MSKNESYLLLALVAWVAYTTGRSRGIAIGAASASSSPYAVGGGTDWLNGWNAF